jgi:glucan phosphoethanolaminetransferase (alkaline phosphatase superfamily)
MDYIREWIRNLFTDLLVIVLVCVVMLIFMRIFYPDTLSFMFLTGQFAVQLANVLKLWPLIILAVIAYSLPRRRRRR